MQQNSPPPTPTPAYPFRDVELASAAPQPGDPTSPSIFDWSDFLDFDVDQILGTSLLHSELGPGPGPELEPELNNSPSPPNSDRIRKRDPRLLCSNFVSGRIPCACPELDKKLEEEEEEDSAHPGKKRARMVRASNGGPMRCQVPGCEADISELKGYHKRHRVCLQCANATSVLLDGVEKRYCQQCGKFHILSNFDEGKRSCRWKLNKHNDRRRRKSNDPKGGIGKEAQHVNSADDVKDDDDAEKDGTSLSSQSEEREILHLQGDSVASFARPVEVQNNGQKQSQISTHSESFHENKNKYSSVCPAGRISFKLYDWNPAEFPRRLRLQIFEWLASMPVELEGYIRPGCIILTAFIAMPKPMWLKLSEKPASYIKDFVSSPGNMLYGRGTMLFYLNDMIFRVTKDSIVQVGVEDRSPKLHYIYPTCFEAGRPMEFVACGSNLLQPKFRFLVSFGGRYLAYNICVLSLCCKKGNSKDFDHQLVKISVPETGTNIFGPAFVEVENQSGLSNFIPILIGDKETCEEMEILQQKMETSESFQEQVSSPLRPTCEVLATRRRQFSGFLLDVAWSAKKPASEQPLTSSHMQRFNCLLNFLIEKESSIVLERVICSLRSAIIRNNTTDGVSDSDVRSLREKMGIAERMVDQKLQEKGSAAAMVDRNICSRGFRKENQFDVLATKAGVEETVEDTPVCEDSSSTPETVPLINGEVVMNVNFYARPRKSWGGLLVSRTFLASRPLVVAIATVCVCLGVCAALFHPQRVTQIATTIRRCLFDNS